MKDFDLKKFLTENKLTSNSRLNEDREVEFGDSVKYKGKVVRVGKVLSADRLVIVTTNAQGDFEKQEIDKKELDEPVTLKMREEPKPEPKPEPTPEPEPAPRSEPTPEPEDEEDEEDDDLPYDYYEGKKEFSVYTTSGDFHSFLESEFDAKIEMYNDGEYYGSGTVELTYDETQRVENYGGEVDIDAAQVTKSY